MATRFYVGRDTAVVFNPSNTFQGNWDASELVATKARLHHNRNGIGTQISFNETSAVSGFTQPMWRGVSDPIKTAVTIDGTFSAVLLCREADAAANMVVQVHVWVTTGDSNVARGTLLSNYVDGTEFQVHASNFGAITISPQALTSVSAQPGDRIVVEIGYAALNTTTTAQTGVIKVGGTSSDAVGTETTEAASGTVAAWVEISDDIEFAPTYLYTTANAAPATPPSDRGTWDATSGSKIDAELGQAKGGASSQITATETSAVQNDVLQARFVSAELAAQTIDGDIDFLLRYIETASTADAFLKVHLYVMQSDGSVRGTLLNNSVSATEANFINLTVWNFTLSSVAAQDGDRLVLEVGTRFTNVTTVSQGSSLYVGGPNADVAAADNATNTEVSGWVRFEDGIEWFVAPSGFPHSQAVVA